MLVQKALRQGIPQRCGDWRLVTAGGTRLSGAKQHVGRVPSSNGRYASTSLQAASSADVPSGGAGEAAASSADNASASEDGPWSPDYIREMVRQEEAEEERLRSEELTREFREDPQGLYDYVQRAYQEGGRHVITPMTALLEDASGEPTIGFSAALANDVIGMGSWRLKSLVDPIIEFMVSRIEGCWREILDTDLCLYPREKWKDIGWDLADSEDPKRELDGFSYADIPDPEEDAEGYPRLLLENRVYCSKVFRKLHLEVGIRQDGLQVLHVVVYPRYSYDLPIFGLDIVIVRDRVTLAVVDCCPTRKDLKLPVHYMETMALLQQTFMSGQGPANRRIPDWGLASFSPLAVCITPAGPEELAAFAKYAVALHRAHLTMSLNVAPVVAGPGDRREAARLQELLEGQKRFCDNQLANEKTRRILQKAFGSEWTEGYMSKLMFDFDPTYEPPYFDASFERLYTYFDENPEFGDLAAEATALEMEAERERAAETLQQATKGKPVTREKLTLAMQFLYRNDPTFQAAVQTLMKDKVQEMPPEEALTEELLKALQES